ncbi:MAG: TetR family transcriptional regulator [Herbiconiux sp.]|uniref:TetR/AcrR family transcriptional regulator n=1 Tax=Herbiconiux sp. TaxID=1871186 RepID=UPI001207B116|nr:TetR family transcriptional regulator [Herbiconiux sp.]TAJ46082.1 MAG: TetR family transcriptional regulator [Herbiconiux sp.]
MVESKNKVRRVDALSKDRIVLAAVEILDASGEGGLTTRSLAASLNTGSGAIFHHVGSRDELLRTAVDSVIADVTAGMAHEGTPEESIRMLMLGVFDAIQAHPWVGAQLAREPWQPALLEIFFEIGSRLQLLGVPEAELFDAASTLLGYLLGVASQHAAAVNLSRNTDRANRRASSDHPFAPHVTRLADHDDRVQFVAGVEIILAGIA